MLAVGLAQVALLGAVVLVGLVLGGPAARPAVAALRREREGRRQPAGRGRAPQGGHPTAAAHGRGEANCVTGKLIKSTK